MPDRDNPDKKAAEEKAELERLVEVDRQFTMLFGTDVMTVTAIETGKTLAEVHYRGGTPTGFRDPDGHLSILSSNDVIHKYGASGHVETRIVVGNLPEGYTPLTPVELQRELFRATNMPQTGNFRN